MKVQRSSGNIFCDLGFGSKETDVSDCVPNLLVEFEAADTDAEMSAGSVRLRGFFIDVMTGDHETIYTHAVSRIVGRV